MTKGIRQGDVLLVPLPAGGKPKGQRVKSIRGRYILAEGEHTGHDHAILDRPNVEMRRDGQRTFLAITKMAAELAHQEHTALTIEPGDYEVIVQRKVMPTLERTFRDYD